MDRQAEMKTERSVEVSQGIAGCNVLHKFPTLHLQSENSCVKIGDEFEFSENVLIVVPDESKKENGGKTGEKEDPRGNSLKRKLSNEERKLAKSWFLHRLTTIRKVGFAIMFVIVVGGVLVITLKSSKEEYAEIPDYVSRELWGTAKKRCPYPNLERPIPLVIIQHTGGTFCNNFAECEQSVKNSQNWHLSHSYNCDVSFGFLVGGDCRIYEGRNFSQRENLPHDPFYNWSVEVAFIGDYSREQPLDCQMKKLLHFLKNSVSDGFLDKNFKVIGASQAYSYENKSPGKNLMDKIMQWDMWINITTFSP